MFGSGFSGELRIGVPCRHSGLISLQRAFRFVGYLNYVGDTPVKFRELGNSGVQLSTIGLGTWALGGGDWKVAWGPQDDNESIRTIRHAIDCGINWIDTAAVYGLGHSETVVGRALAEMSERPFIATKCGRVWDESGNISGNNSGASIRRECEDSLRRLGIDCIDLYQIHWAIYNSEQLAEDGWATMAELVQEGKVHHIGLSNATAQQIEDLGKIHPVTSLQPPYSMLRRDIEDEILPCCEREHVGVIPYSPMQKGLLTGKVTAEWVAALPDSDHRRNDPDFNSPKLDAHLDVVCELRKQAEERGCTPGQLAIAWVLRRPEVTAAIVGGRRPEQIAESAKAADIEW